MITRKLLITVLGPKETEIKEDNSLFVRTDFGWQKFNGIDCPEGLNIYELAHKCKEWAKHNYEYTIYSGLQDNWISYFNGLDLNFTADSEAESIFKACDYLVSKFENKDQ